MSRSKKEIGIEQIEYYLPGNTISALELCNKFGFSEDFINDKIGISKLYFASKDEKTSDLAAQALNKLLSKNNGLREKIGVLVVCTQTPDFQLPQCATIVQKKCEL